MNTTIIYVSSNREDPEFEKKIQEDLLSKSNGLPIVSVTQKPTDLGKNICVGDVGASGYNFCRQVQIACQNATTPFVTSAEADCVYSPDYFDFVPTRLDIPYRNSNIYVQKYRGDFVNKKSMSTFSQVVDREFYLSRFDYLFGDAPMWNTELKNFPKEWGKFLFEEFETFETKYGCISFKTGRGMRKHSPTGTTEVYELPYWGKISDLKKKYGII